MPQNFRVERLRQWSNMRGKRFRSNCFRVCNIERKRISRTLLAKFLSSESANWKVEHYVFFLSSLSKRANALFWILFLTYSSSSAEPSDHERGKNCHWIPQEKVLFLLLAPHADSFSQRNLKHPQDRFFLRRGKISHSNSPVCVNARCDAVNIAPLTLVR